MPLKLIQRFLQQESLSGILLFLMALLAMLWANSPFAFIHQQFTHTFLFWINEGLMTIFFLVVGLELKRGFLEGEFSEFSQVALPAFAALGGMLVPALVYVGINYANPITLKGWATPVATDIAFALGVLSLFGKRIPASLKLFLLALAIFDDIGAIIIISLFHSHNVSIFWLILSCTIVLMLYLLKYFTDSLFPYLLMGIVLWVCLFYAGLHPTIAGVILAMMIPSSLSSENPANYLENKLHPWSAFVIMPLFALANAGFSLRGLSANILTDAIVLGIMLGLFIGKQVGVFGFSWILIYFKGAKLPEETTWLSLYGVAILCGIGFTMSLFLGTLSFQNGESLHLGEVRLGVILGSLLSALMGAIVLLIAVVERRRLKK